MGVGVTQDPASGSLQELKLDISYRTSEKDIVRTFYSPCLRRSVVYRRAVGYFTSGALAVAAKGVAHLIENDGSIRLVASPSLTDEDVEAINLGYKQRSEVVEEAVRLQFQEVHEKLVSDRLDALAWLIASKRLDVRLALRVDADGLLRRGIFHEKTGIFSDAEGNHVAFSGSSNETVGGLVDNHEVIDVFCSWDDPHFRVKRKMDEYDALWEGTTAGLEVTHFNDVAREVLERFRRRVPPSRDPLEPEDRKTVRLVGSPMTPPAIELRPYQASARDRWFDNNGRGMLKMATGSGKTITALSIAVRLARAYGLRAAIIVCPFRHLVTQWARECRRHRMDPLLAYGSRKSWFGALGDRVLAIRRTDNDRFLTVITTNSTFAGAPFQKRLRYFPQEHTLLIADEVHNLGATKLSTTLPTSIPLRLGLSATPERWFDDSGTQALFDYFGKVLRPEFTLKDAIDTGALCRYQYFPVMIELDEDEQQEYREITGHIAKAGGNADIVDESNERLMALFIKRARLVACAKDKFRALREVMTSRGECKHMLFYCGDGTVSDVAGSQGNQLFGRYVEVVAGILNSEFRMRVATYTAETSIKQREHLRVDFASGNLDGLVAIRCLDEGVDIPGIRTAVIMASSANPRQFIQRRGRVLRNSPGKKVAEIIDFIVVPPEDTIGSPLERGLLRRELKRFTEFADLAVNAGVAREAIWELQKTFDLMEI